MVNKKLRVMSKVSLIKTECNLDLEVPKFFLYVFCYSRLCYNDFRL